MRTIAARSAGLRSRLFAVSVMLAGFLAAAPADGVDTPAREDTEIGSLATWARGNEQRLQSSRLAYEDLLRSVAPFPEASRAAVDAAVREQKELVASLASLEKALRELNESVGGTPSVTDLLKALSDARRERDEQAKKQADELSAAKTQSSARGLPEASLVRGMKPTSMKLVKNRVVPMTPTYFSVKEIRAKDSKTGEVIDAVNVSRTSDGESVDEALRPGGVIGSALAKMDPKKDFFRLEVCVDSILAFRAVTGLLATKGYAYSWDTAKDRDVILPKNRTNRTGNGGGNAEQWLTLPRRSE